MNNNTACLAAILNRLADHDCVRFTLSDEEAKCLQTHLVGIEDVLREAERQDDEVEAMRAYTAVTFMPLDD